MFESFLPSLQSVKVFLRTKTAMAENCIFWKSKITQTPNLQVWKNCFYALKLFIEVWVFWFYFFSFQGFLDKNGKCRKGCYEFLFQGRIVYIIIALECNTRALKSVVGM